MAKDAMDGLHTNILLSYCEAKYFYEMHLTAQKWYPLLDYTIINFNYFSILHSIVNLNRMLDYPISVLILVATNWIILNKMEI